MEPSWNRPGSVLDAPGSRLGSAWGHLCGDLWAVLRITAVSMGLQSGQVLQALIRRFYPDVTDADVLTVIEFRLAEAFPDGL